MDYVNAFWVGGLDLRTCTDFTGEDDATAGPYYGAAASWRAQYSVQSDGMSR